MNWRLAEISFFEDTETTLNFICKEMNFILGHLNAATVLEYTGRLSVLLLFTCVTRTV